jgi:hypothetical protein
VLGLDRVGFQRGELGQAQVKDRRRLDRREIKALDELLARGFAVG